MRYIWGMEQFDLRAWRKANGYTQEQLAERFGVSRWTIARIEAVADSTGLAPSYIKLACQALECIPGGNQNQR